MGGVQLRDEPNRLHLLDLQHHSFLISVFNRTNHHVHELEEYCQTHGVLVRKYIFENYRYLEDILLSEGFTRGHDGGEGVA